jgi:hypothetical protein
MQNPPKVPVPNHVHGRVTDINQRLRLVRNQFNHTLDHLRPSIDEEKGESKLSEISHSVQSKLNETSDLVHDIEILANEFEQFIGTAEEGMKARAIG